MDNRETGQSATAHQSRSRASGISIALDAMGGDHAPDVNIDGALEALKKADNLRVILVGDREKLLARFKQKSVEENDRLSIVHAAETISMQDHASTVLRKKKDSSILVGLRLLKEKKVDAFMSAGNSGAVMVGALGALGRLPDVERPAILVKLPTADGFAILLDAGANVDCKTSHIVQFAEMGSVYAEVIEGIEKPRIGLLSNGTESHKGNELTREAAEALSGLDDIRYIGYVEGFDLFRGTTDVVVCDGFAGNILLKGVEGIAETAFRWWRKELKSDLLGLAGFFLLRRLLKKFRGKFDYQPYGAAPLLGINGMVMISHGSSTVLAIRNGLLTALRGVEQDFIEKIAERFHGKDKQLGESNA